MGPADRAAVPAADALGRYAIDATGGMQIGWPGSGIRLTGTAMPVVIDIEDSGLNLFDLWVDGERSVMMPHAGRHTYTFGPASDGQTHTVTLRRRSESFATGLSTLYLPDGVVPKSPAEGRRVLFLGDSLTAGYGSLGADETCDYAPASSSSHDAFAARTADRFGADYHLIAISGRGVVLNYDDDPHPNMLGTLALALPDTPVKWNSDWWTPDVVVVALGSNDFSTNNPGTSFAANYAGILVVLAAQYPDAKLITATGPLSDDDKGIALQAGVDEAIARAKTLGVSVASVTLSLAETGHVYGCDYHPGADSVAAMTDILSDALQAETGWTPLTKVD